MKKSIVSVVLNNFINDSRVLKESISLKKAGYDITVAAVHTEHVPENELIQDIPVQRIHLKTRRLPKNRIFQFFKYLEFTFKFCKRYKDVNIIHCNDLETLPIGVLIKLFINRKIKVIYDAHEFETERNVNQNKLIKKILSIFEKLLIKHADHVITVSESIAHEYARRYRIDTPSIILNCPLNSDFIKTDIFRKKFHLSESSTIFIYQGALMARRGIENTLKAFERIDHLDKVVVFMGYGQLEEKIISAATEYKNIFFQPAVQPESVLEYTASADFGIILNENDCLNHNYCLPNKFFEYIMAGLPVISSNLYEISRIIEKYQIGLIVKNGSPKDIIQTINKLDTFDTGRMRENLKEVSKIYNWNNQEKTLLKIYETKK